ncbi:MAG TPA: tetratricopeptide repeat protein [Paracoccaceae bacterium]|nr:tetratricopeptide repeat protein [Paracoccaceae bacterium]
MAALVLALSACSLVTEALPTGWTADHTKVENAHPAPGPWLALGLRLLDEGDDLHAERAFIRSLRVEGPSAAAFTGAGIAASRQGLLTRAIRHFEHARELDPHYAAAHNNLGAALYAQGDYRGAERAFRAAYRAADSDRVEITKNLAMSEMALREIGAEPEAAATMLTALAENEDAQPVNTGIGTLQRIGRSGYRLSPGPDGESL